MTDVARTSDHLFEPPMDWCKACGRPLWEIVDNNLRKCDGDPLKIHPRYWEARERAGLIFDDIVQEVIDSLPLPGETT